MRAISCLFALLLALPAPLAAQDPPAAPGAGEAPAAGDAGDEPRLDDDALDELVAPVALYPDALLSQVLMAATYPLEIVKADRFLDDNVTLTDKERADAAQGEDWDPSVQVLAGGFPDVVAHMADDIDWTESLGDAMVAQTDDVLDAVQRMRAQAAASGNLETNEAQTVETTGDTIAIAPTDPERIYVPSYDPVTAYTTMPVTTGVSTTGLITTGAVAFGTALLLDDIFDDDDDCCWHGPDSIDWDDREIHVDRDVNRDINRHVTRNIDRNIERDRTAWKPSDGQRDAARARISEHGALNRNGGGARPEVRDARRSAAADRLESRDVVATQHRAEAKTRGAANLKGKAPGARPAAAGAHHSPKQVSRPNHPAAHKAPPRKPQAKSSAFHKPPATARPHAQAAKRGHASAGHHARRR